MKASSPRKKKSSEATQVRAKLNARKKQREEAIKINELIMFKKEKSKKPESTGIDTPPPQVRPWGKLDEPPSQHGRQSVESLPEIPSAEPSPRQQEESPSQQGSSCKQKSAQASSPASVAPARDAEAVAALEEKLQCGLMLSAEEMQQLSRWAAEDSSSSHSPSPHHRGTGPPTSKEKPSPRRTRVAIKGQEHGTKKQNGPLASFVPSHDEQTFKVQLRAAMGKRAAWCVDVFKDFDRGSGAIGRADFHKALRRLGLTDAVPRRLVDALFTSWDVDCSGTLDVIELRRVLRRETERDPTGKMSDDAVYLLEVRAREAKRLAMREQAAMRRQLQQSLEKSSKDHVTAAYSSPRPADRPTWLCLSLHCHS